MAPPTAPARKRNMAWEKFKKYFYHGVHRALQIAFLIHAISGINGDLIRMLTTPLPAIATLFASPQEYLSTILWGVPE
jgi:hypothetical protein